MGQLRRFKQLLQQPLQVGSGSFGFGSTAGRQGSLFLQGGTALFYRLFFVFQLLFIGHIPCHGCRFGMLYRAAYRAWHAVLQGFCQNPRLPPQPQQLLPAVSLLRCCKLLFQHQILLFRILLLVFTGS